MTLLEHLGELRRRLMWSFAIVVVTTIVGYVISEEVFHWLTRPYFAYFPGQPLIGTSPGEAFLLQLQVSFFTGLVLGSPLLFHQAWLFISPALLDHERPLVWPFLFATTGLLLLGVWFCFTTVLPVSFGFFNDTYKNLGITPNIRISEYISFVLQATLGFGLVFEWPVVAYFLARVGIIDGSTLVNGGRYAIVVIFVLSGVLTPPDVLSQFLMAGPLFVLYGISIVITKIAAKQRNRRSEDAEAEQPKAADA